MSVMTFRAPSRLASMEDMMFASSSFVSAQNTSVFSMFSLRSRSPSVASPCRTTARSSSSESWRARRPSYSRSFTE